MTTNTETTENPNEAAAQPSQCCELLAAGTKVWVVEDYGLQVGEIVGETRLEGRTVAVTVAVPFNKEKFVMVSNVALTPQNAYNLALERADEVRGWPAILENDAAQLAELYDLFSS